MTHLQIITHIIIMNDASNLISNVSPMISTMLSHNGVSRRMAKLEKKSPSLVTWSTLNIVQSWQHAVNVSEPFE